MRDGVDVKKGENERKKTRLNIPRKTADEILRGNCDRNDVRI